MRAEDEFLSALSFQDAARSPTSAATHCPSSPSPVRAALESIPTLHSMLSDSGAAFYPAAYPSGFYSAPSGAEANVTGRSPITASASRGGTFAYGYGAWRSQYARQEMDSRDTVSSTAAAVAATASTEAAVAAAEKQRRVLKMELDVTEEQRRRLAARMSPSSTSRHSSAQRISLESVGAAPTTQETTADDAVGVIKNMECAAPGEITAEEVAGEAGERGTRESTSSPREVSVSAAAVVAACTAPPPCSPSPPLAHVYTKALLNDGEVEVCTSQASTSPPNKTQSIFARSTEVRHSFSEDEWLPDNGSPDRQTTPSPSPSRVVEDIYHLDGEAEAGMPPALPRAALERSPRAASLPRATLRRSVELHDTEVPVRQRRTHAATSAPRSPSRKLSASPPRNTAAPAAHSNHSRIKLNAAANDLKEEEEKEERMYAAYQRKLARIQQALRMSTYSPVRESFASVEARLAYQRRRHLSTPGMRSPRGRGGYQGLPLRASQQQMPSSWEVKQSNIMRTQNMYTDAASSPYPFAYPPEQPLIRRAPSLDSWTASAMKDSYPRNLPRQLQWHLAKSGNVVVSPDGFVCRADAADAIRLIEEEYADRLTEVLPQLVIPFYAMGNIGSTHDAMLFSFRWISPVADQLRREQLRRTNKKNKSNSTLTLCKPPMLAFGFATHAFTGYGTEAPAFLYLSTGAIAQGLRAPNTPAGAERPYGAPFRPGLELGARLDLGRGVLEFYVESVSMGVAFRFCPARHPAPLFPVVVFSTEGDVAELLYSA